MLIIYLFFQISQIVGFTINPNQDMSLIKLIDMNLDSHISKFELISESASKESSLEKAMEKMKKEWAPVSRSFIFIYKFA